VTVRAIEEMEETDEHRGDFDVIRRDVLRPAVEVVRFQHGDAAIGVVAADANSSGI